MLKVVTYAALIGRDLIEVLWKDVLRRNFRKSEAEPL